VDAAVKINNFDEVERVIKENTVYNPEEVKNFLKENKMADPRPMI